MKKEKSLLCVLFLSFIILLLVCFGCFILMLPNEVKKDNAVKQTEKQDIIKDKYILTDYVTVKEYPITIEKKNYYFTNYKLKQVEFNNLDNSLVTGFNNKQSTSLSNALKDAETYFQQKGEAVTDINTEINKNVLSIRSYSNIELMAYPILEYNYLNINLDTKTILNTTQMIDLFGYDKDKLINEIANSLDKYSDYASINNIEISKTDFLNKKEEFKIYIKNHLNEFGVYSKNNQLYCDNFSLKLLVDLGYSYPTDGIRPAEIIKLQK